MSDEKPSANPPDGPARPSLSLARASWSVTALAFIAGAIALIVRGDYGYSIVALVIAVGAAINLLP